MKLNSYNVVFIGRTGNGKTSLINALFGTKFSTDPLVSCTKELYSVSMMDGAPDGYEAITIYDTPGIGEYSSIVKYQRYYEHAIQEADCVVLVTTFDRTDAPAQRLLVQLKPFLNPEKKVKFIIALNHIDSKIITDSEGQYQPWDNECNCPSEECLKFIEQRKEVINNKFSNKFLDDFSIIPVCALKRYGIESLKTALIK